MACVWFFEFKQSFWWIQAISRLTFGGQSIKTSRLSVIIFDAVKTYKRRRIEMRLKQKKKKITYKGERFLQSHRKIFSNCAAVRNDECSGYDDDSLNGKSAFRAAHWPKTVSNRGCSTTICHDQRKQTVRKSRQRHLRVFTNYKL